ncbi:uncharacterized protein LOC129229659 [Uloborus diversus]|uniref:uncharacterized protein LOC129229659 n=1 Tax=Uloborus diversus TaxID=327109 RepID=UPI002408F5D5|nr:uncharacterized protein LOC129229659 [Uloborus diversus]
MIGLNRIQEFLFTWWLVIPCFLGYIHSNDPILKYMCSIEIGAKFWTDLIQCSVVLDREILSALNTCVPTSNSDEAEKTRQYVCSRPEQWVKMMNCMNIYLIQLQDDTKANQELSPGTLYRTCVSVLIGEAEYSDKTGEPFLQEGNDTTVTHDMKT